MGILESQIRARFGNLDKEIREQIRKSKEIKFELIQRRYNKIFKECITIIAETIDNKCIPLSKNDFPKIKS